MSNNELLKTVAISCNHSEKTQRIYRLELTQYASILIRICMNY
ncbi:hypothetical protein [Methanobrevibacter gottschalkii]|nr:hypothetical protein [Methanobrevibacter gottschalkii]